LIFLSAFTGGPDMHTTFIATASIIALLIPLLAFYLIWHFNGLLTFFFSIKEIDSNIWVSILGASGILSLVYGNHYGSNFYDYNTNFILSHAIVFGIAGIVCFTTSKREIQKTTNKLIVIPGLIISLCFYSYGTIAFIDKYFDNTKAKPFEVNVIGKYNQSGWGKSASYTYWLDLDTCSLWQIVQQTKVPSNLYNKTEPGNHIQIYLKEGYLGIPWYYLKED
jgi:hypothetical protein